MQNELFEKAPIPKAYMKMALPVIMGMIVTLVAFVLFRANLWKEVF